MILSGLTAGIALKDTPPPAEKPTRSFWADFADLFRWETVTRNRDLFLLLLILMLSAIGTNVSMPYFVIYLENFIGMSKTQFSIVGGAALLGSALVAVPFGLLADRWDRRKMLILAVVISCMGRVALSLVHGMLPIAVASFFWLAFAVAVLVASTAWLKDLLPEESVGRFLGVRMIFFIAIPMVIGPIIGSSLIRTFGIPIETNGQSGFIPVPIIFQVSALVSFLSLIPLLVIGSKRKALERGGRG